MYYTQKLSDTCVTQVRSFKENKNSIKFRNIKRNIYQSQPITEQIRQLQSCVWISEKNFPYTQLYGANFVVLASNHFNL